MALSRKFLEGMGLEEKQVDSIIEAHAETVNALKAERERFKEIADRVPDLEKQIEDSKAASASGDTWREKLDSLTKEFEAYKAQVETEKADAAKAVAYREMLLGIGIDPRRVDKIMRLTDLSDLSFEDGKIVDPEKVEQAARDEWSDFIVQTKTIGADPATPPQVANGIEGADPHVTKMLQERHDRLYGKSIEPKEG